MKEPTFERTSAAKAGWLIFLLMVGWLGFLFWPGPVKEPAVKPPAIPLPPSALNRVGLDDNPDWDSLPAIFAIWADKAEWKDDRTRFAYWHPVMKNYSYYFEAVRADGDYRFKEIAEPRDPEGYWDEGLGEDCPIRFWVSFPSPTTKAAAPIPSFSNPGLERKKENPGKIRVEIANPDMKGIPPTPEPKP